MKYFLLTGIFIGLILSACSQYDPAPSPNPPHLLRVGITASLNPMIRNKVVSCAESIPEMNLIIEEVSTELLPKNAYDVYIQIGDYIPSNEELIVQLGWEEIVLIASLDIDIRELNIEALRMEYSSPQQPKYNLWSFPKNHEIRNIFDEFVLPGLDVSPYISIVFTPEEMVKSIKVYNNSLGYIPRSWYQDGIQIIDFESPSNLNWRIPILAHSEQNPGKETKRLLLCMQTGSQDFY